MRSLPQQLYKHITRARGFLAQNHMVCTLSCQDDLVQDERREAMKILFNPWDVVNGWMELNQDTYVHGGQMRDVG